MKLKAKFVEITEPSPLAKHFLGRIDIAKRHNRKFKDNEIDKLTYLLTNSSIELTYDSYAVQVWIYQDDSADERVNYAKRLVQMVIASLKDYN